MISYFYNLYCRVMTEEDGVAATEYAILVALILVMCIAAVLGTGDVQKAMWFDTADKMQAIVPPVAGN
jgi:Flp pilus assembly pilin Flp